MRVSSSISTSTSAPCSGKRREDQRSFLAVVIALPSIDGRRPPADDSAIIDASLIVEVLSPSSLRHDRFAKRRFFQKHGVPAYWIVDPDGESIEIWRPGEERPEVRDDETAWQPEGAAQAFHLDIKEFFSEVSDENWPGHNHGPLGRPHLETKKKH